MEVSVSNLLVMAALAAAVAYYANGSDKLLKRPSQLLEEYDYVIVGGGSAGATLASRLALLSNASILLLEAGPAEYRPWYHFIPGLVAYLQQTDVDWRYITEPQPKLLKAITDQRSVWASGRKLGGGSAINYMVWNRGDASDYDRWAERPGCAGWSFAEVEPVLKALETTSFNSDKAHRGQSGPFEVRHMTDEPTALVEELMKQAAALGYKTNVDYNTAGNHQSWSFGQTNVDARGRRGDAASVLLRPAMQARPNLHVMTDAMVEKVTFAADANFKQPPRASGVQFTWKQKPETITVRARKEVVLSAGTVRTPQLLMLSGLGDKKHLKQKQIPLVSHLPAVGQNLHDHLALFATLSSNDSRAHGGLHQVGQPLFMLQEFAKYWTTGKGLFGTTGESLKAHLTSGLRPGYQSDTQVFFTDVDIFGRCDQRQLDNYNWRKEHCLDTIADVDEGRVLFTSVVILNHPASSGHIKLRSNDVNDAPLIQPNYLSQPVDLQILRKGLRSLMEVVLSVPKYDLRLHNKCESRPTNAASLASDAHVDCLIRDFSTTLYHPVGTARMGADSSNSVVDNSLSVHGVRGLRVADNSVLPTTIGGNTNVAALMIGWRAADRLIVDNESSP